MKPGIIKEETNWMPGQRSSKVNYKCTYCGVNKMGYGESFDHECQQQITEVRSSSITTNTFHQTNPLVPKSEFTEITPLSKKKKAEELYKGRVKKAEEFVKEALGMNAWQHLKNKK